MAISQIARQALEQQEHQKENAAAWEIHNWNQFETYRRNFEESLRLGLFDGKHRLINYRGKADGDLVAISSGPSSKDQLRTLYKSSGCFATVNAVAMSREVNINPDLFTVTCTDAIFWPLKQALSKFNSTAENIPCVFLPVYADPKVIQLAGDRVVFFAFDAFLDKNGKPLDFTDPDFVEKRIGPVGRVTPCGISATQIFEIGHYLGFQRMFGYGYDFCIIDNLEDISGREWYPGDETIILPVEWKEGEKRELYSNPKLNEHFVNLYAALVNSPWGGKVKFHGEGIFKGSRWEA